MEHLFALLCTLSIVAGLFTPDPWRSGAQFLSSSWIPEINGEKQIRCHSINNADRTVRLIDVCSILPHPVSICSRTIAMKRALSVSTIPGFRPVRAARGFISKFFEI